ncbi:leucine-rich repeat protein SHOC-2-like isoform X1 [Physella acuta]|uniref:leucine-rich repeat protein SHOC-2-like isoform X1 n=1 Tax=Physella acuta TaxID=109671 RepID=UPI0027DD2673|nr:leucine-rich repeat protein SHOC-2-like isoform X1 [Physella acuta]
MISNMQTVKCQVQNSEKAACGLTRMSERCPNLYLTLDIKLNVMRLSCVYLDFVNISCLPLGMSKQIPLLKVLSLSGNKLTYIPDDFGDFENLVELCLSRNNIQMLPETLSKLKKLEMLKVNANVLTKLYSEIGQNVNLIILKVDANKLKRLPATLGLLKNLCVLEAQNNKINNIPPTIKFLIHLLKVNFSCNHLVDVPQTFGELKYLKHIDLSYNRLSSLCEIFNSSSTLEYLCLDFNRFSTCPEWFNYLQNLSILSMTHNKLRNAALPNGFGLLNAKLNTLDLRGNFITHLPDTVGKLHCLKKLYLGLGTSTVNTVRIACIFGNWLEKLPDSFISLTSLTVLHINQNQLKEIPSEFGKLINLIDLHLDSNMLVKLPKSFPQLASLKRCHLSSNRISILPPDFGLLVTLTELYLNSNKNKFDVVYSTCITLKAMCYDEFVSFQKERLDENAIYDKEIFFERNDTQTSCLNYNTDEDWDKEISISCIKKSTILKTEDFPKQFLYAHDNNVDGQFESDIE